MYRRSEVFMRHLTIFFSVVMFYALFYYLVLTLQPTVAQTDLLTSPRLTNVIAKYSTQMPQYNDKNSMAVLVTSDDQLTGIHIGSVPWKNVAMGSDSIRNSVPGF